jgi:hypothetical protein
MLLDFLGAEAGYEPECHLLAGGVCYQPDWKLLGEDFYIEARGYMSAKGQAQVESFVDILPLGATYAVLRDEKCGGSQCYSNGAWGELCLCLERPIHRIPVRCRQSVPEFQLYGMWLELDELRDAIEKEGGTLHGGRLGSK